MSTFATILAGGFLMSVIALVGSITTILQPGTLQKILIPMVSLAAGTLLGGAFFHMIPAGLRHIDPIAAGAWIVCGFSVFLALEQGLHWHHCRRADADCRKPMTYLILIGDGLHNFLGGLGVASVFLLDPHAGVIAWIAAAAHEIPQELGDFGVLVHGGWNRSQALAWNFVSGLTFLVGALVAYTLSFQFDISGLVLFGAGNFIYIAASDLVPEIKGHPDIRQSTLFFGCFCAGIALLFALALIFH